jgi:hypothetical protein
VSRAPVISISDSPPWLAPKPSDPVRIDAIPVMRMRQYDVERDFERQRTQRLHRDEFPEMKNCIENIRQPVEPDVGNARVAVEWRDDDVTIR